MLFPFLYLTLELPKRIINDAIGAGSGSVAFLGSELSQTTFLGVLCLVFLISVLLHGLLKMRINTMKGVLSERMLRRFRYQLVTRMLRFPRPYFQRTSQAEIVSMVTAEAEPLGGMMGDAISQPILQVGQMLTILTFLFLQSFWFGLAAVALIPLQAWIIPVLQRRINVLNKERIKEVRALAAEIGETAAGSTTLRTSGGHTFRAALITHRLGRLFFIRLDIYRKKFFMKFLNNFITQLTPFFFFSIGGYLVIIGNVSIGALVAALAAYKDLSAPWKELLVYYTRVHEMSQRWRLITDHFAPAVMLDQSLIEGQPKTVEPLTGDIVFSDVSARDEDGLAVVQDLDLTLPAGGTIAIAADTEEERRAFAELLTREVVPSEGQITIGGRALASLHQVEIGSGIGWVNSKPYLFAGTIGENMLLPLKTAGAKTDEDLPDIASARREAESTGNSEALLEDNWIDPVRIGMTDEAAVWTWWLSLVEGMGADQELIRRGLGLSIPAGQVPELTQAVVDLRPEIRARLKGDGLGSIVTPFNPDTYQTALPVIQNILFAVPTALIDQTGLARHTDFLPLLRELELTEVVVDLAQAVVDLLHTTFGSVGTDHPLFQRLGIDAATFDTTLKLSGKVTAKGHRSLKDAELALLLALPCVLRPEHVGQFVAVDMQERIVALRRKRSGHVNGRFADIFAPLDPAAYIAGLTLLENAVFGVISETVSNREDMLAGTVAAVLIEHGLKPYLATLTLNEVTLLGGNNLPPRVRERISFTRAAIKRPDIFVLDQPLQSYAEDARQTAIAHLRIALPQTTIIHIDSSFPDPNSYDMLVTLQQGRISSGGLPTTQTDQPEATTADLASKLQAIKQSVFFSGVDQKQLRLLAFSAKTFEMPAGGLVVAQGDDPSDGVYLILKGEADFFAPRADGKETHVRTAGPGSLVGELALVLGEPRTLSMRARRDLAGLRIGAEEFLSVVQNDAGTSFKFLQLIAGYVSNGSGSADPDV